MNSYRQCRNQVNILHKASLKQYFSDKILSNKGMWKNHGRLSVNCLINNANLQILTSLEDTNQTLFDNQRISEKINEFFGLL